MIYLELNFWDFEDTIARITRTTSYTREGLRCIFDYYNEAEEPFSFDWEVIKACWTEYENLTAGLADYEAADVEELQDNGFDVFPTGIDERVMIYDPSAI